MFLGILGVFDEFETVLRRKRRLEEIADAKARGVYKGRRTSIDPAEIGHMTTDRIGASASVKALKIGRASVHRTLGAPNRESGALAPTIPSIP